MTPVQLVALVCTAQVFAQIGAILDLAGGMSVLGWSLAFGHIAVVLAVGFWLHRRLGPRPLAGDR